MNKDHHNLPSPLFTRLFRWFCRPEYFEELQGDLEERFYRDAMELGVSKAQAIYRLQILKMLRPSVVRRPFKTKKLMMSSLFYMNFKLAMRNLVRHKVFSAVNIFGLAAALSVSLFLVNLIHTGFNLDRQHDDNSRLYRIETTFRQEKDADLNQIATIPYPVVAQLKEGIPDIEEVCQINKSAYTEFDLNGETITVFGIATEPIFNEMFNFEVLQGNMADVYNDVNSVAITDEVAQRLFKDDYPIGKVSKDQKVVRAVIQSPKGNSHMQFDMVTSLSKKPVSDDENTPFNLSWAEFYSNYAYVKLREGTVEQAFAQRLQTFSGRMNDLSGLEDTHFDFRAKPVKMIVFEEPVMNEIGIVVGSEGLTVFVTMIAVLMFIAGFNYTNLSIARAIQRTKEIGIRKTSGSSNFQIASQILVETLVFSMLGLFLGIGIYRYFSDDFVANIPFVADLFNPEMDINILLTFVVFAVFTGLMAGLFPAMHFSRVNPLLLFNPRLKSKKISLMWVRKALTTFQLTLSMFCLLFMIMLSKQAQLIKTAPQGIETENRLIIRTSQKEAQLLKPLVEKIPTVISSSLMSNIPGYAMGQTMPYYALDNGDGELKAHYFFTDEHFGEVLAPKLLSGHFFSETIANKSSREVLVNQQLLKEMNIEFSRAIDHNIKTKDGYFSIVGVFEDIAMGNPFNHKAEPVMIIGARKARNQGTMILHIDERGKEQTINQLEAAWKEVHTDARFSPEYLSLYLNKPVEEFINLVKAQGFMAFAIIAIALLGQLGISLYNAETRVKEIGIRKVLGAKISAIIKLLLKGTIIPLLIAAVIASPIAYLLFQDGIASSIRVPLEIGPGLFMQGLLLLGTLVVGVVISQTWRIARQNPTESLRAE